MGHFQGKKYDVLLSRTYTLGSVVSQAYTSGNLFGTNLTAPANGYISVRASSSANNCVAYLS